MVTEPYEATRKDKHQSQGIQTLPESYLRLVLRLSGEAARLRWFAGADLGLATLACSATKVTATDIDVGPGVGTSDPDRRASIWTGSVPSLALKKQAGICILRDARCFARHRLSAPANAEAGLTGNFGHCNRHRWHIRLVSSLALMSVHSEGGRGEDSATFHVVFMKSEAGSQTVDRDSLYDI